MASECEGETLKDLLKCYDYILLHNQECDNSHFFPEILLCEHAYMIVET